MHIDLMDRNRKNCRAFKKIREYEKKMSTRILFQGFSHSPITTYIHIKRDAFAENANILGKSRVHFSCHCMDLPVSFCHNLDDKKKNYLLCQSRFTIYVQPLPRHGFCVDSVFQLHHIAKHYRVIDSTMQ